MVAQRLAHLPLVLKVPDSIPARTGSLAHDPSTISSLVLLLDLISLFPTNELRVATNA